MDKLNDDLQKLQINLDNYINYCNILENEYNLKHQELLKLNNILEKKQDENTELKKFFKSIYKKTPSKKNLQKNKNNLKNKIKTQKKIKSNSNLKIKEIKNKLSKS